MPIEQLTTELQSAKPKRAVFPAIIRGFSGKCPSCGSGKLFERGLRIQSNCANCAEQLHHHRADDLPAYLNIFVIGHIVVALTMIVMDMKIIGTWSLVAFACILAIAMAFLLMRPLKGMVVGAQWAMHMHGFGGYED